MLKHRTITATILAIIFCIVLFALPNLYFAIACFLAMSIGISEFNKMYKFNPLLQMASIITLGLLGFGAYFTSYDISQIIRFIAVLMWCFIAPTIIITQPKIFSKPIIFLLGILIFLPAFYSLFMLRGFLGSQQLLSIIAIAWVADTGAYFVGRKFGKHKLAPTISPNKSIEGAIGGLLLVIIYLAILKELNITIYLYNYSAALKFGIILCTASIIGDLLESWFKRIANVKDSGKLLPGHGGVFDRIDSLVAVLAIGFALIRGLI